MFTGQTHLCLVFVYRYSSTLEEAECVAEGSARTKPQIVMFKAFFTVSATAAYITTQMDRQTNVMTMMVMTIKMTMSKNNTHTGKK